MASLDVFCHVGCLAGLRVRRGGEGGLVHRSVSRFFSSAVAHLMATCSYCLSFSVVTGLVDTEHHRIWIGKFFSFIPSFQTTCMPFIVLICSGVGRGGTEGLYIVKYLLFYCTE